MYIFVVFQQFIHQNIELIQDILVMTLGISAIYFFEIFGFFFHFFSIKMNGSVFNIIKTLQNVHKSLLYFSSFVKVLLFQLVCSNISHL